jgi:segregation and condensation protein B
LRTLAAIALKKGIAQTELVELRGSGAYQHVQELVELGFVRKRRQPESRSYWLQVTDKFFQYFQLDQLPQQLSLNLRELAKEERLIDEKQAETSGDVSTESPAETEIEEEETSGEAARETPTEISSADSSDRN